MPLDLHNNTELELASPSTYKLEGKAFWQWWQLSNSFKLGPKRQPDPLRNEALQGLASFILTCPFGVALMLYLALQRAESVHIFELAKTTVMAACVWIFMIALFVRAFRHHQNYAQEVTVTPTGIEFKSAFQREKFQWYEVKDIYKFTDTSSGIPVYKVECKNQKKYFLVSELTQFKELLTVIESKLSRSSSSEYHASYRVSDAVFDSASMAASAIVIAIAFSLLKQTVMPPPGDLLLYGSLCVVAIALDWIHQNKIPQEVRLGKSSIFIQTRKGSQTIGWDQIQKTKKIGTAVLLQTRSNWFFLSFMGKDLAPNLLEYKKDVLGQ